MVEILANRKRRRKKKTCNHRAKRRRQKTRRRRRRKYKRRRTRKNQRGGNKEKKKMYSKILGTAGAFGGSLPWMRAGLARAYRRHTQVSPSFPISEREYNREKIGNSVKGFADYVIAMMGENPYKIIGYLSHGAGYYVVPMQKKRVLTKLAKLAFGNLDLSAPMPVVWIYNKPILEDILGKFKTKTGEKYANLPTNAETFIRDIIIKYSPQGDGGGDGQKYYKEHPLLECLIQRLFGEGPESNHSIFKSSKEDCYSPSNNAFWQDILPSNNLSIKTI